MQAIQFVTYLENANSDFTIGNFWVNVHKIENGYSVKVTRKNIPWKHIYGIIIPTYDGKTFAYSFNVWSSTIVFGINVNSKRCAFGFIVNPGFNNYGK